MTPVRRSRLTWPRLPAWAELATIGAWYGAYYLVRLALTPGHQAAFAHAAWLWGAETRLHLNIEPAINHLVSARAALALPTGYYYGLLHFIVTPLVLGWLYLRRRAAFPRLRSALVLATTGANLVFWTWPLAPPRFFLPGMTDILVTRDILGAADPHGPTSLVDLYAAMPSLHVAWAVWCAIAVVTTTRSRWRHLAWLYPSATTFVVLASANHFLLDAIGGLAVISFGLLATRGRGAVRWAVPVVRSAGRGGDPVPDAQRAALLAEAKAQLLAQGYTGADIEDPATPQRWVRGTLQFGDGQIVTDVNSAKRLARLLEVLTKTGADPVVTSEKRIDPAQDLPWPGGEHASPGGAASPAEGWEKHWLDEQVPALHGRTPRQAARGKERPLLEALLRQFEYEADLLAVGRKSGVDTRWLRDELGMIDDLDG